jgi:hypothetical protein
VTDTPGPGGQHRTQDQIDADEVLDAAIRRCVEAYGYLPGGEFVGDYVVVIETTDVTDDAGGGYCTLLPRGVLAAHRIVGLLDLALDSRLASTRPDLDDG